MSQGWANAVAEWLNSNQGKTIGARSTALNSERKIIRTDGDDITIVPISEANRGGQAATCQAWVTIEGEPLDGEIAVRAERLDPGTSKRRRADAMWMAYIAASDRKAAGVLLSPWRTAEVTVAASALGSERDGTETLGLDIMPWAKPFADAFVGVSGQARMNRAVELAIPLFVGVDRIYESYGFIHRDIDPSNVMFGGGRLVLVDWGIVSIVAEGTSRVTSTLAGKFGTPYFAPEARGGEIGWFTDAWSLGALLCTMACGEAPAVPDISTRELEMPTGWQALPSWLRDIITGLTALDRDERMTLKSAVERLQAAGAADVTADGSPNEPRTSWAATTPPATVTSPPNDDLADRRIRARTLLAEGYEHGRLGRTREALAAYTAVIDTGDGSPDPLLRQLVAMALNNQQWSQHRLGQQAETVAICSRLVHTFGDDPDLVLRQQVAIALNGSGYAKREFGLSEQAVDDWDEVIARFGAQADLVLRQQVAMALRDKGLALAGLDRRVDAVASYTRLIESFERDPDLTIRRQVAMGLNNKRWSLYWLGQHAEAIAACTRLVDVFGGDRDLVVRQQVATALRSKGLILNRSQRREDAIAAYGRLVDIFSDDLDPVVQESVTWARQQLRAA